MHKTKNNKVTIFSKDLEKFIEEQKTPKERNQDLRKKIVSLGAKVKKEQKNFKDIKFIKENLKKKNIEKKEYLKQSGIKKTRRYRK